MKLMLNILSIELICYTAVSNSALVRVDVVMQAHEEHPNIASRTGLIQAEPNDPLNRMEQGHTKRPNQLPEQSDPYRSDYMMDGEGIHGANEIIRRHHKQRNRESVGRGIISAEKTQEKPLNQFRHQAQDQHSSYAFRMKQTHLDHRDRVNEVQADSIDPTVFSESRCIALIDETTATRINCTTVHSVGPKPINVDKNQAQAPNSKRIIQQAQKQPSYIAISQENAQDKHADGVVHVQEKQLRTASQVNHRQETCAQLDNQTVAGDSSGRIRCPEKEQSEPFSCTIRKRKRRVCWLIQIQVLNLGAVNVWPKILLLQKTKNTAKTSLLSSRFLKMTKYLLQSWILNQYTGILLRGKLHLQLATCQLPSQTVNHQKMSLMICICLLQIRVCLTLQISTESLTAYALVHPLGI